MTARTPTGGLPRERGVRRDVTLVAIGQLVAVVSAFLLTVVGARLLSPEEFGALSWALSWVTYLAVVAQLGLTQVATISLADPRLVRPQPVVQRLLVAQGVGLLLVVPVWWLLIGPVASGVGDPPTAYGPLIALTALWLPAAAVGPVVVNALRARGRSAAAVLFGEHVRRLVLVGLILMAALVPGGLGLRPVVAWAVALETVIYLVGVLVLLRETRVGDADADGAPIPTPSSMLRSGAGFTVATLASVTVPQAGVWLLAAFVPVGEVAVFSVAVRVALLVGTPTVIVMRTLAPRVVAAHRAGDLGRLEQTIRRSALWSTGATGLAVLGLAVGGRWLLPALFGQEYASALPAALILCVGMLVNAGTGPCSVVLSHAGRSRTVAASAVVSSLTFLVLAAWLASWAGGAGVAAAAAVAMSGRNLHLARAARRSLGITTLPSLSPRRR